MNRAVYGLRATVLALGCWASLGAQAQLFGDDQARQAILDLRQRFDTAVTAQNRLVEENAQMRRSLLDLQQQIEAMRGDVARLRGQGEQASRDLSDAQRRQQEGSASLEERLRKLEAADAARTAAAAAAPPPVPVDATANANATANAAANPAATQTGGPGDALDRQQYESALAVFRSGDFNAAQSAFAAFIKRHPRSGYAPSALFWLGNAQYATRNYKEAITNFRSLLTAAPNHQKAPEALLSIANCQIELKDTRAARATLESLIKTYPKSEAAQAGRERLAKL